MSGRTFTVANQITTLRLIFVPLFAVLAVDGRYGGALVVLAIAAASDVVDGMVARVFHQQSALGVALDPAADKLLMSTAYLVLSFRAALVAYFSGLVPGCRNCSDRNPDQPHFRLSAFFSHFLGQGLYCHADCGSPGGGQRTSSNSVCHSGVAPGVHLSRCGVYSHFRDSLPHYWASALQ